MIGKDGRELTAKVVVVERVREDGRIGWWEEYEVFRRNLNMITRVSWWVN